MKIAYEILPDVDKNKNFLLIIARCEEKDKFIAQEISDSLLNEGIKSLHNILDFMKNRLLEV